MQHFFCNGLRIRNQVPSKPETAPLKQDLQSTREASASPLQLSATPFPTRPFEEWGQKFTILNLLMTLMRKKKPVPRQVRRSLVKRRTSSRTGTGLLSRWSWAEDSWRKSTALSCQNQTLLPSRTHRRGALKQVYFIHLKPSTRHIFGQQYSDIHIRGWGSSSPLLVLSHLTQ